MDSAAPAAMIACMIQTTGAVEAAAVISPEVLAGLIGFAGAVLGSLVGVVGGVLVWRLQHKTSEKRIVRRELVRAYVGLLQCDAHFLRVWSDRALLPPEQAPDDAAQRRATARFDRFQFHVAILDGDEQTRILATKAATVLYDALDVPMATLRSMADEPRTKHVQAVRREFREAQKHLLMHLEKRFRIAPRTGRHGAGDAVNL